MMESTAPQGPGYGALTSPTVAEMKDFSLRENELEAELAAQLEMQAKEADIKARVLARKHREELK